MSHNIFNDVIKKHITNKYPVESVLLDIGPMDGKYSKLLDDRYIIDCIEVFPAYITKYELPLFYRNVICGDATKIDFDFSYYDLVIMGDVLEHIERKEAIKLVAKITRTTDLIAVVPYDYPHPEVHGNSYQEHKQEDLNRKVMLDNYSGAKLLSEADVGQFITSLWVWHGKA